MILIKVVVAGSRGFDDYELLKATLDSALQMYSYDEIEIVSGCADGADKLGEKYQEENKMKLKEFPADWDSFGDSAGHLRNLDMAHYGNWIFCFWDGSSKGTKGMIDISKRLGKTLHVIKYK